MAVEFRVFAAFGVLSVLSRKITDVNCAALQYGATGYRVAIDRQPFRRVARRRNMTIISHVMKQFTFQAEDHGIICLTQSGGILPNGVQHRADIRPRT